MKRNDKNTRNIYSLRLKKCSVSCHSDVLHSHGNLHCSKFSSFFKFALSHTTVVMFCYHKITSRIDFGICVRTPDDFARDVRWVASLPAELRPHFIFDDGYDDTFHTAYPILESFGFKASLFVITDWIGKRNDWDANFFGKFEHISLPALRELAAAGWEIGSHGASHRALTTLSSAELRREVFSSKRYLEDARGVAVRKISFPFGLFNQRVIDACQDAGYDSAVSIRCASACGYVQRSLAVYRFDRQSHLRAKLHCHWLELMRLRAINSFSGLTVLMHQLKNSV